MRITNSMMVSNFMNNLTTNLNKLDKLQGQLATNRKWAHISDDPISVIYSQQAREKLHKLGQYQSNVESAQEWLTQVETSAMDLNKILVSAYESAMDASTDVKGPADKTNAAQYMKQLRDQVLTTLNTTFGDKYIFGGYNTTGHLDADNKQQPPFTAGTETYIDVNGIERERSYLMFNGIRVSNNTDAEQAELDKIMDDVLSFDVGLSIEMEVTLRGTHVVSTESYNTVEYKYAQLIDADPPPHGTPDPASQLKDAEGNLLFDSKGEPVYETVATDVKGRESNIFELLDELYRASEDSDRQRYNKAVDGEDPKLAATDQPATGAELISSHITRLQNAQSGMLSVVADLGGRTQRLELMASRYEQDNLNYTQMKSNAEDMDQAEIIMNYKMAESVYKAALSTGSYIIQPTLMDFLR